jgi:hypothetical protein
MLDFFQENMNDDKNVADGGQRAQMSGNLAWKIYLL